MKSKIKPVLVIMIVCGALAACKISSEKDVTKNNDAPVDSAAVLTTPDSASMLPDSAAHR